MEDMLKMTQKLIRAQNPKIVYVPSMVAKGRRAARALLRRVPFPLPTPATGLTRSYIDAQGADYLKNPKTLGFRRPGHHAGRSWRASWITSARTGTKGPTRASAGQPSSDRTADARGEERDKRPREARIGEAAPCRTNVPCHRIVARRRAKGRRVTFARR